MELRRIGVSLYPRSTLSVEFLRDGKLLVWRVEFDTVQSPVEDLVLSLKERFPEYLAPVSAVQLTRLVRFAATVRDLNKLDDEELGRVKLSMQNKFDRHHIPESRKDFIYDYQIDFAPPHADASSFSDDER